ncbi:MAG TPA: hypothetical protein VF107_10575, partial [Burkholderiaceae bacterium]
MASIASSAIWRRVFGAEDLFGRQAAPRLDAAAFDDLHRTVDDRHRVGMRLAGVDVQEERQRH